MNALLGDLEIAVIRLDILFGYVLGDHVIRDIPTRGDEVPSGPQVTSPKRSIQRPKVPHESA